MKQLNGTQITQICRRCPQIGKRICEDLAEMNERLARMRGGQRGCAFAEAFRGCGTFPEPDGGIRFLVRLLEG